MVKKLIIAQIAGGLGNQMFQYAVARAASYRTKIPFNLDITYYQNTDFRSYKLKHFNVIENFISKKEFSLIKRPRRKNIYKYITYLFRSKIFPWNKIKTIIQDGPSFNNNILKIKYSVYLKGYWQSEKYFIDVKNIILEDFCFKNKPDKANRRMLDKIINNNSISLHIRRGDYVQNKEVRNKHGVLSLEYYNNSINYLSNIITDPCFFIFSDDIDVSFR